MTNPDIRAKGFQIKTPLQTAVEILLAGVSALPPDDTESRLACGRVLARAIECPRPVPSFNRSAMDGFAVRGCDIKDTPVSLRLAGTSLPAQPCQQWGGQSSAVRVATGAAVPDGADTVVPVEECLVDGPQVLIRSTLPPGKNVILTGEDFRAGQTVLNAGHRLRPHDMAVLSALGVDRVQLVRRPVISILVTGNELLPPFSRPDGDRICDANSPMLRALGERDGAAIGPATHIRDLKESLASSLLEHSASDVILVSGGSSVGVEDHGAGALAGVGALEVHGLALRPATPAGFGRLPSGTRVFLLPGNPVSCLCAYELLSGRLIRRLGGQPDALPHRTMRLPLASRLVSVAGRTDFARVRIRDHEAEPVAISGAGRLRTVALADGFVLIPPEAEVLQQGELVTVHLF